MIRDWARSALSGRYAAAGPEHDPGHADLEHAMGRVDADVHAVVLQDDWLAPRSSLQYLLAKLGRPSARVKVLDEAALGARADHFAWMKQPQRVVDHLIG